jgi:hypothetical protein
MPVETETSVRVPTRGEMLRKSDNVKRAALSSGEVTRSGRPVHVSLSIYEDKIYSPEEVVGETGDNIYSISQKERKGLIVMPRNKLLTVAAARDYHKRFKIKEEVLIYNPLKREEKKRAYASG